MNRLPRKHKKRLKRYFATKFPEYSKRKHMRISISTMSNIMYGVSIKIDKSTIALYVGNNFTFVRRKFIKQEATPTAL